MMVNHLKQPLNSKKYTISLKSRILITFLLITISSDAQQERPPKIMILNICAQFIKVILLTF